MDFTTKNRLRKESRDIALKSDKPGVLREARRMRRVRRGAFGTAPNHLFNLMVVGTSVQGQQREDKGDDRIPVVVLP